MWFKEEKIKESLFLLYIVWYCDPQLFWADMYVGHMV